MGGLAATIVTGFGLCGVVAGGQLSITGNQDFATVGANSTIGVSGSTDFVNAVGSGVSLTVTGTNDGTAISSGTIGVSSGSVLTISGNNDGVSAGQGNATVGIIGNSDTISGGSGNVVTFTGTGDAAVLSNGTIGLCSGSAVSLTGSGNTVSAGAGGSSIAVIGAGNVLSGAGPSFIWTGTNPVFPDGYVALASPENDDNFGDGIFSNAAGSGTSSGSSTGGANSIINPAAQEIADYINHSGNAAAARFFAGDSAIGYDNAGDAIVIGPLAAPTAMALGLD